MAKVYKAPIEYEEDYTARDWLKRENDYLEQLRKIATTRVPNNDLIGEIVRWPRGDGYAQYMIWDTKPLSLVWIETGDAWSVEEPLLRGLRLTDIKKMVAGERKIKEIFGKSKWPKKGEV